MDIRIKAGQPINLEVEFEGEPAPTASWTINEKDFTGNEHADLLIKEHVSTIQISSSLRSDSGFYAITIKNEFGIDSSKCHVTVLDVPGTPKELSESKIYKEGCTLSWKPPEDNGGSEILHYIVEKMDVSRGTWQEVGQYGDTTAKLTKLTPNKQYLFRVKAVYNLILTKKILFYFFTGKFTR